MEESAACFEAHEEHVTSREPVGYCSGATLSWLKQGMHSQLCGVTVLRRPKMPLHFTYSCDV